jgi:chromosome segregation ATPase
MADIRYSTERPSNWPHPTKEGLQRRVGKLQKRLEHAKHMMRQKSDEIHALRVLVNDLQSQLNATLAETTGVRTLQYSPNP